MKVKEYISLNENDMQTGNIYLQNGMRMEIALSKMVDFINYTFPSIPNMLGTVEIIILVHLPALFIVN